MINHELILAYESAKYVVEINKQPCRLFVNKTNNKIVDTVLCEHKKTAAYFITPENPFSQLLSVEENALRHKRFVKILNERGYKYYVGYGTDEADNWANEKSYLVLCGDQETMHKLASQFGQNGLLKLEPHSCVKLQILRPLIYEDV
jgi:hypothetical protein